MAQNTNVNISQTECVRVNKIIYKSTAKFVLFDGQRMKLNQKTGDVSATPESNVYIVMEDIASPKGYTIVQGDVLACTQIAQENYGDTPRLKIVQYSLYRSGVLLYVQKVLGSACPNRASKIRSLVRKHGENLIKMVAEDLPAVLQELNITFPPEVERIEAKIRDTSEAEAAKYFAAYNLPADKLQLLIKYYNKIQDEFHLPGLLSYILDSVDAWYDFCIDGLLTFSEADSVAKKLLPEIKPNDSRRLSAAISAVMLDSRQQGDSYAAKSNLFDRAISLLGVPNSMSIQKDLDDVLLQRSIKIDADCQYPTFKLSGSYFVCDDPDSDDPRVYNPNLWNGEVKIADGIKTRLNQQTPWKTDTLASILKQFRRSNPLSPEQELAVAVMLRSPISILTGGPGTGKSHTIKALVYAISQLKSNAAVQIAAPTGKAAVRLKGITSNPPKTLHKLLHLNEYTQNKYVIDPDFLIIDEASMVDMQMMCEVLHQTSEHTQIVLAGDENQLPSIGPGCLLRDLIQSGLIPVARLTQVHRTNGNLIIDNAAKILATSPSHQDKLCFSTDGDMDFLDCPEKLVLLKIAEQYEQHISAGKKVTDIAVLCSRNEGRIGKNTINQYLQSIFQLHSSGFECGNGKFYFVGDPVMQTVNDYNRGVMNGEIGIVESIGKTEIAVQYPGHPACVVYDKSSASTDLDLAYAITIHKSQGSEFSVAIIPVTKHTHLHKTLFYTAVTRAKDKCILLGDGAMIGPSCKLDHGSERKTTLVQRLQGTLIPPMQPKDTKTDQAPDVNDADVSYEQMVICNYEERAG